MSDIVRARVIRQKPDHSCLFHCFEWHLSGKSNAGHRMRQRLAGWMRVNGKKVIGGQSLEDYVKMSSAHHRVEPRMQDAAAFCAHARSVSCSDSHFGRLEARHVDGRLLPPDAGR